MNQGVGQPQSRSGVIGYAGLAVGCLAMVVSSIVMSRDPALFGLDREDPAYDLKAAGDVFLSSAVSAVAAMVLVSGVSACIDRCRPRLLMPVVMPGIHIPLLGGAAFQPIQPIQHQLATHLLVRPLYDEDDPNMRSDLRVGVTLQRVQMVQPIGITTLTPPPEVGGIDSTVWRDIAAQNLGQRPIVQHQIAAQHLSETPISTAHENLLTN